MLVQIWVILPPPPLTVTRTEVLSLSNLFRNVFSVIILESLRSVIVNYFVATMFLYLSVELFTRYYSRASDPLSQQPFVLKMKNRRLILALKI